MSVRRVHHPPADVEGRRHNPVHAEPLQAEDGAHDVDDRIECADLMQMNLLHRHVVDGGLGFSEPLEKGFRPIAPRRGQGGLVDQPVDFGKAPVRVAV
jgi:hypothetical protein